MSKAIVSSALLVLFIASVTNAQTTHPVGGSSNWNTGVNYDNWASGTTFATGDTLVFTYGPSHDVAEVNQADYDSCSMSNLISTNTNSPTRITLSDPGTRYFVCSRSNHCSRGMKVTVTTAAASGGTPSPPSGTTPTPRTPSTHSTPNGGAAGRSGLAVGLFSVAAVLGFMA